MAGEAVEYEDGGVEQMMADIKDIAPYEDREVEWTAIGRWRTASRLVPTGGEVVVESKRCARATSTWA